MGKLDETDPAYWAQDRFRITAPEGAPPPAPAFGETDPAYWANDRFRIKAPETTQTKPVKRKNCSVCQADTSYWNGRGWSCMSCKHVTDESDPYDV
ncbi:hypothetical protein ABZ721_30830 [Streptomyces sp. NPDC006733]|uniref:hypothetical protein n=1 Tax=Streptomyces sp. NPDC006733 TaxID=3155460 RepID=UPI00340E4462